MKKEVESVEKRNKDSWHSVNDDLTKIDGRLSSAENSIVNLKTDNAALTTLINQMQMQITRIDQKLDKILDSIQ